MLEQIFEFNATQPSIWTVQLTPFSSIITINDLEVIGEILSSTKFINKSVDYQLVQPWLGTGLLVSTGKKWHQRRKIITPAFHFKILEQFVEVMEKHGGIFVEKLKKLQGQEINIFPLISLYALDVICESAMGYELNAQSDTACDYVNSVKEYTRNCFLFLYDVFLRIPMFPKRTKWLARQKYLLEKMHKFTKSVISERRGKFQKNEDLIDEYGSKKKLAFLDLLLQSTIEGKPLEDEDIREEVDTFMFEGHDTTTSGIAFILYNLAKYPKIQQQVYDECKLLSETPTMQDLNQLSYLEKVIKESMRLYPPVPAISRSVEKPETIGGVTFPPKAVLKISPLLLGRNEKLFSDPLKFNPLRFDDEESVKLFSYIPFSAGPRNCIGQRFAMLEMKNIVSKIVKTFELIPSDKTPTLASELVLRPADGIYLTFKAR